MNNNIYRTAGNSLLAGSFILIITMGLHPTGGSIEHLLDHIPMIVTVHSIALLALPFIAFGCWGLTRSLLSLPALSAIGIITMCCALFAALCAATINGLALPVFLQHYRTPDAATINLIKPVFKYGSSLNQGFDLVYMGATCFAITAWSLAMARTNIFPAWISVIGFAVTISFIVALLIGTTLTNFTGFRIFIAVVVTWLIGTGILLRKINTTISIL